MDSSVDLDPSRHYRLHPRVAVRPEPFGALVYHYGNRKLVFLKSPNMLRVVRGLNGSVSVDEALRSAGIPTRSRDNYLRALTSLLSSDMIVAEETADATAR